MQPVLAIFGIFTDLIDALNAMVCLLQNLAWVIAWSMCSVLNFVIWCCGMTLAALVAVLPTIPTIPAAPSSNVLNFIRWAIPISSILASAFLWLTIYGIWLAYSVLARWMRAM